MFMSCHTTTRRGSETQHKCFTDDSILLADLHFCCSHVANLDFTMCSINEDVVALDVAVDNWWVV